MGYHKSSSYLATLSVALGVALVPFTFMTPQLRAQQLYAKLTFPRTPVGAPRNSVGGGTRSSTPLTVLSPQNNLVTTVSAQPTLFWYVPQSPAKSAEFAVYNEQRQIIYQTTLALEGIPGVVKLSLPKTVTLETGKEYSWQLTLKSDQSDELMMDVPTVSGKIKRTVLTSAQKSQLVAAKQPLKQAEVYAKAGVWQETLSILAQLHRDHPSDRNVETAWKDLLESVELQKFADKPLVECCRADQ